MVGAAAASDMGDQSVFQPEHRNHPTSIDSLAPTDLVRGIFEPFKESKELNCYLCGQCISDNWR